MALSENVVYPFLPNGFADQTIPIFYGYFIVDDFPMETFVNMGYSIATFDCRRVTIHRMWAPAVVSWCINPINYSNYRLMYH